MTRRERPFSFVVSRSPYVGDTDALGHTQADRARMAAHVISEAFHILAQHGWTPPLTVLQEHQKRDESEAIGLEQALSWGLRSSGEHEVAHWYARLALNQLMGCGFWVWEAHPLRHVEDVLHAMRTSIRRLGGVVPGMPVFRNEPKRGGWRLSSGPERRSA